VATRTQNKLRSDFVDMDIDMDEKFNIHGKPDYNGKQEYKIWLVPTIINCFNWSVIAWAYR